MYKRIFLNIFIVFLTTANIAGCAFSEEKNLAYEQCYRENQCNSSSWISSALGGTKACNECNSELLSSDEGHQ